MSTPHQARQPAGSPVGGQFATSERVEGDVDLTTPTTGAVGRAEVEPVYGYPDFADVKPGDEMKQAGQWVRVADAHPNADGDMMTVVFDNGGGMTIPISHRPPVRREAAIGSQTWRQEVESMLGHMDAHHVIRIGSATITVSRVPASDQSGEAVPGCYQGAYTVIDEVTGQRDDVPYDNLGRTAAKESKALRIASNWVAQAAAGPLTTDGPGQATHTWGSVDADDRYPGEYTAYVATGDGYTLRVAPGDGDSYLADGYEWRTAVGLDHYSGIARTREEAAREAVAAADYVLSGEAEADYWAAIEDAER